jgi:hypothetical protein
MAPLHNPFGTEAVDFLAVADNPKLAVKSVSWAIATVYI